MRGKWCPLSKLIETNVIDTIKYLTTITDPPSILHVSGTSGFDGNGGNSRWRSLYYDGHNMILGGCSIISIHDDFTIDINEY